LLISHEEGRVSSSGRVLRARSHAFHGLSAVPEERLQQRIHAGHHCWVIPEEERFVTRELIEGCCLVGTAEE